MDESLEFCLLESLNKKYNLLCHNYYQYDILELSFENGKITISMTCLYVLGKKSSSKIPTLKRKTFLNELKQSADKCDILLQKCVFKTPPPLNSKLKLPTTQEGTPLLVAFTLYSTVARTPWEGVGKKEENPLLQQKYFQYKIFFILCRGFQVKGLFDEKIPYLYKIQRARKTKIL